MTLVMCELSNTYSFTGFTVNPNFPPLIPLIGTAIYVYGNAMIIFSVIPYLFDAFPPAATLSALTAAASARLIFAGVLPLLILQFFGAVTPKWALAIFGFISVATWPIPFVLFRYGAIWRSKSRYSHVPMSEPMNIPHRMPSHDEETGYENGMRGYSDNAVGSYGDARA